MSNQAQPKEKKKETIGETIRSVFWIVLLGLLFRTLAFEPFHIPSGSMLSTLYEGDYVFVNKYTYGYSWVSTPINLSPREGRWLPGTPERGDVVVFWVPEAGKNYIKRIIGLPGDTVQVRQGRLYLNGDMVDQTRDGEVTLPDDCGEAQNLLRYREALPGGRTHAVLDDPSATDPNSTCEFTQASRLSRIKGIDPDNTEAYQVPAGHYFMMGDNRDHSQDSRFSAQAGYAEAPGFVAFENIVGRAEMIAFSWKTISGRWFKAIE